VTGRPVRIGTRGSPLAMAQATLVRDALAAADATAELIVIETDGDRRAPDTAWGEGAFVAAIERALLEGRVDLAVHSAKDVPTDEDPRLRIAAYLPRGDARDAVVLPTGASVRRLADLPARARVGTDSPRRTGFVRAVRPDVVVHPLHGNVDTRLRRLDAGETDALVLACAGLDRLGLGHRIAERLDPEMVPPAPGQGAIAIQASSDAEALLMLCRAIDHAPTRAAVEAERAFLSATGGGCRSPIGAVGTIDGEFLELVGGLARDDGLVEFASIRGSRGDPVGIGRELALRITAPGRPRVIVTRAARQAHSLVAAIREAGLEPVLVPAIEIELSPPGSRIAEAARVLHSYRWVVVTSANGASAIVSAGQRAQADLRAPKWAAIGAATEEVLDGAGVDVAFTPSSSTAARMAAELPVKPGDRVLRVRGDLADDTVPAILGERGATVDDVVGYRTCEAPTASGPRLRVAIEQGAIRAIVFTSGSTVRGLQSLASDHSLDIRGIPAVCIGPETAAVALAEGFRVLATAPSPDAVVLARTTAEAINRELQEAT
jgi:hydroxymethylbilane synthase